jgi:hypothetical protein
MSKVVSILEALRGRLEDAGHTVYLGRVIDPEQDALPLVTLRFDDEGESTTDTRPRPRKALSLVAEHWTYTNTSDPLLELVPLGDGIEAALVQPIADGTDRLGGLAIDVEHVSTSLLAHHDYTDVGLAQVAIRVSYVKG